MYFLMNSCIESVAISAPLEGEMGMMAVLHVLFEKCCAAVGKYDTIHVYMMDPRVYCEKIAALVLHV